MNCHDFMDYMNDAVDGTLPIPVQQAYTEHVSSCSECAEAEQQLRTLLEEVNKLPTNILPDRDLWTGIEQQLSASPKTLVAFPSVRKIITRLVLVAAAVAIIVNVGTQPPAPSYPEVTPIATHTPTQNDLVAAEYAQAKESLMMTLDERRDELSPVTLATIEENLTIIENAIIDINRAMETNPNDPQLERTLHAAYHSEVTLLQHAVQLDNDEH